MASTGEWQDVGRPPGERPSEARSPWREPGHDARSPAQIPAQGWWQVLKRVVTEFSRDQLSIVAAGCAFYALLALFPALTALVSIYGLVADPATVEQQLSALQGIVPEAAYGIIDGQLKALASAGGTALGWSLALSLGLALYSASSGVKTIFTALNIAYEEDETRGTIKFNLVALLFTFGAILVIILAIGVVLGLPAVMSVVPWGPAAEWGARIGTWAVLLALITLGIGLLYRFGPSRKPAGWKWLTAGSIMATILWLIASVGFSFYASNFASYNETYGALAGVVILLLWLWITCLVILLGAELNSELELQTRADTTTDAPQPMGQRGAFAADHTAKAHRNEQADL